MDEKKEKSLSRMREEIAMFQPVLEVLKADPGEMGNLQAFLVENLIDNHKVIIDCVEQGKPFLASQFTNPVEILTAMDVPWYFHVQQQFAAGGTGGSPHTMEDLEEMDRLGVPSDCCTLLRLLLYYQVAGLLPIPTAYLALTEPCDGVAGLHAAFMNHPDWRDVPVFAPDVPYHDDPRAFDYYAGELKRMVDFITKHTGKTMDMDRLKRVVTETNKGLCTVAGIQRPEAGGARAPQLCHADVRLLHPQYCRRRGPCENAMVQGHGGQRRSANT